MEEYLLALLSLITTPDLPDPDELFARIDAIADAMNSRLEDRYDVFRDFVAASPVEPLARFYDILPEDLPRLPFFDDDDDEP